MENKRNLSLDLFNCKGDKVCSLYDNNFDVSGQATNVILSVERNGWKEFSFNIPSTMEDPVRGTVKNYRIDLLKADYRIRAIDDFETDWYIVSEPKITHNGLSRNVSVVAGHVSQLLKYKNLGLEFSDEYRNNVGTAEELLTTILAGTGWNVGDVSLFYEDDKTTIKRRTLKASAKTGAFKLISMMCELFDAKPVYHGDSKTVDIIPINPFSLDVNEMYPDVSKADGVIELYYGRNVSNITRTMNTENMVTKLYCYGSYGDYVTGYCGIEECKHKKYTFILSADAVQNQRYYISTTDNAGIVTKRYFTPGNIINAGTSMVWSDLDPCSMSYIYDIDNEKAYVLDKNNNVLSDESSISTIDSGTQFILNGDGSLGDNTNFLSFDFDSRHTNNSLGSFTRKSSGTVFSDDYIALSSNTKYVFEFDAESTNGLASLYSMLVFYDVDRNCILPYNTMYVPNTLTTLAQDLEDGDTVVHLTDISNWNNNTSGEFYKRGFIVWNYTNSNGYTYPENTYSRNVFADLFTDANVDKENNTITLSKPWAFGTIDAGTKLSQRDDDTAFKILGAEGFNVPSMWNHYSEKINTAIDNSGRNIDGMYPPGTAYVRAGFVWNANEADDQIWITNLSLKPDANPDPGDTAIELPCSDITVEDAQNWFSFIMDYDYYLENNMLTDEAIQAIAAYQINGEQYIKAIQEASLDYSNAMTELSSTIGKCNYCKISIAQIDTSEAYTKLILNTDDYEDGVIYRSDYDVSSKNYFKLHTTSSIKPNGDPVNSAASVLYHIKKTSDPNVYRWEKIYFKEFNDDDHPTEITLWTPLTDANINDEYFIFESNNVNGMLGAYEVMDESSYQTIISEATVATTKHPVIFAQTAPAVPTSDLEYGWWYKYNENTSIDSDDIGSCLYFCYSAEGDLAWKRVWTDESEAQSESSNGDYYYDWKRNRLNRKVSGEWMFLDEVNEKRAAKLTSAIWLECVKRDKYYKGQYQKYTMTVDSEIAKGDYYFVDKYGKYYLFTTDKILDDGDKLSFDTTDGFMTETVSGVDSTINVKNYAFDNVFYHPANVMGNAAYELGDLSLRQRDDGSYYVVEVESSTKNRSTYEEIESNLTYVVSGVPQGSTIYFFNEDKRYIDKITTITSSFVSPENSRYIRITGPKDALQSVDIHLYDYENAIMVGEEHRNYYNIGEFTGEGDIKGLQTLIKSFADNSDTVYLDKKTELEEVQAEWKQYEENLLASLGDIYKEGYWQKSDYVDGDEDKLYKDGIDNIKQLSKPETKYTINYLDLYGALCENINEQNELNCYFSCDVSILSAVHLIDEDISVNTWAYVDKISKCYDMPWKTTLQINTNLTTMAQHSFTDVMTNIANVASTVKAKDAMYSRAASFSQSGQLSVERLEGTIEANRLKILGGSSSWYTDDKGNMIFESSDGDSAMAITGNGFALANSKDEYGEWLWRQFGTGRGFTADEITSGFISAERIQAGSITASHLSSAVGEDLELSSNKSIIMKVETAKEEVMEDVNTLVGYRIEIRSTSDILSSDIKSTTLRAIVYHGNQDVTSDFAASKFNWHRTSSDHNADVIWDNNHKGVKTITLTTLDVLYSATYDCELTE